MTALAAAPPWRRICVCVDDYGLHPGVRAAVAELAALRRVQAVGAMVGGPDWPAGLPLLRGLAAAGIDIGLHLDLTEHPLLGPPRRGLGRLIAASYLGRVAPRPLRAEIAAQLDAFETGAGQAPAFVDGHRHVHQLPPVARVLLDELQHRYGALRPWLRNTRPPALRGRPAAGGPDAAKARLIASLGAGRLAASAARHGHRQNAHLLGVYDFRGGSARYRDLLAGWLRVAADGDLLMCHPGRGAPAGDVIGGAREAEFEILSGPAFGALLERERVALMRLGEIWAGTAPL